MAQGLTFRCPVCGRISYNPNDAVQHYCGFCHKFFDKEELVKVIGEGAATLQMSDGTRLEIPSLEEATGVCELCGKTEELRPYGPKGEKVCFDCAMKDEEAARRAFEKRFK